ncbi:MAG: LytTR family transcriptional regulator DNA-binding domain-containing protein [Bacteroidia bacterium]|nr:LytTR family transcriptional regulator DNA-binding domain-containing protein [Bacteroidia bacterium]
MNKKLSQIINLLAHEFRLYLSIGIGVFLFILFFQPFPLERFDFSNKLLFIAGLGGIIFLSMLLSRIVILWLIQNNYQIYREVFFRSYLKGFIILAASSVAFPFYLCYVGDVNITFYLMSKVILICLAAPVILWIYDTLWELKKQNESLVKEKEMMQKQVEKYEEDYQNKSIEFISDNNTEKFNILISEIAFIKSADNYVEFVYKEGDIFKKKLLRNTLKNIEQQIKQFSNFIRCHRICIVNIRYIEKFNRNYNNHWLTIKGYDEQIPVSRQYLLKIKEIFNPLG